MKNVLIAAVFIGLIISTVSCKKEVDYNKYSAYGFFEDNFAPEQTFNVDGTLGGTITTTHGTKLTFQPNAFKNSQNVILAGEIVVHIVELYTKSDMIRSNVTSTSNGNLLVSGGELKISAYGDGTGLLIPALPYTIEIPSADSVPMQLYYGEVINIAPNPNGQIVNKAPLLNWIVDTALFNYSNGYYSVNVDRFDWINADYLYVGDSLGMEDTLALALPENFNQFNTVSFISFDGLNACLPYNKSYLGWDGFMPKGLPIHIVTISKIDEKYYFSNTQASVNGQLYEIFPLQKNVSEILAEIDALP